MEKLKQFVVWLDGFLEDKKTLNESETGKIANKLNNLFEHETDSETKNEVSNTPNLAPFNNVPFGTGYQDPITGEKYRC
jgi:hypothetical protein